jgi:formate C-acetyltransferase
MTNQSNTIQRSERVARLREGVLGVPAVCVERGCLITESYKQTEAEIPVMRRAKAIAHILANMSIYIRDGELIVGNSTSKIRGGTLIPEVQWKWMLDEIDTLQTREWDRTLPLSEEEKAKMRGFLSYWDGKALNDMWLTRVPEESLKVHAGFLYQSHTATNGTVHFAHSNVDYEKVLELGLNGHKAQIEEKIKGLNLQDFDDYEKYQFYQAALITLDAAIAFAKRFAVLARELAAKETDAGRKAELEKIAENCDWAPANPARNFHEALQSVWFIHIVLRVEGLGPGVTFGRPDQYLYKYYKNDKEAGKLTDAEACELIALLLVKANDLAILRRAAAAERFGGFPTLANVTIGGVKKDGSDAVNELSYLFLDAESEVGLTVEEYVIRVNKKTPDAFLLKACVVAKQLTGKFKFIGDELVIQQMLERGRPIEYARDYVVCGCFTPAIPSHCYDVTAAAINLPYIFELALNNGASRLTGEQLGPKTGDPRQFKSYEEVFDAYKKQMEYMTAQGVLLRNADFDMFRKYSPYPFLSILYDACMQSGRDLTNGGCAPYQAEGHGLAGLPNVGDSLAAIKKVIFEDGEYSMAELVDALDKNFEGEDRLLYLLGKAPKFGNDDDYADQIMNDVIAHFDGELKKYKSANGGQLVACASTVTSNLQYGKLVGALPDGRKAGEPLAEGGISPHQGRNTNGVTATLRSVAKLYNMKLSGGSVLNVKFNPDALSDEAKIKKLAAILRTYFETGGYHVQLNVVDGQMLKDAMAHPEKYKDLLVRVATYSAYFVELSPEIQNDIIVRTEFESV